MHEENMIAAGDHPVPVDLEVILQALELGDASAIPEMRAAELAGRRIFESVTMTGLLPTYGRSPENNIVGSGGLNNIQTEETECCWESINTDSMKPVRRIKADGALKNIPMVSGQQAQLGDFVGTLISGFEAYASFLSRFKATTDGQGLFDGFEGLFARRLLRNTRFYSLLLERLRDYRNMHDGAEWSAHLDFVARFADWDRPHDPMWPLVRAERSALADLNVPHFVSPTDSDQIADASGILTSTGTQSGLQRARDRFQGFDNEEIAWQVEVIRLSTGAVTRSGNGDGEVARKPIASADISPLSGPDPAVFVRGGEDISRYLCGLAICSGPGAAWIGLDWMGDSDICRPAPLGDDLYNGASGICLFLAAHAKLTGDEEAARLAVAGMSTLRHNLRSLSAARLARGLGTGGANGMGSVVYTLTVLSELLGNEELLADAQRAASLFTGDVVTADRSLDVMDGSAGGILGLLKLYRATKDRHVLDRAMQCGEHLLSQRRFGTEGHRSWVGAGVGDRPLNGMSHGAAGFAFALTSLAAATGTNDFASAAIECVAFENASFSSPHSNWPDFRTRRGEIGPAWLCQWCHGAAGIGLARVGTLRQQTLEGNHLQTDILRAVCCVKESWPYEGDTLCCGNLGNIELLNEAALALHRPELREEASRRLMAIMKAADLRGEYLFDGIDKRFSLGLFRGLAGVGYTLSRQVDPHLPNVLIWE
jgi:type 2 lantibiotic biosynthesis protein LanM